MTFAEAQAELDRLLAARRRGELDAERFAAACSGLRVLDPDQHWWQPDPGGRGWLVFRDGAWRSATPPHPGASPGPVQGAQALGHHTPPARSLMSPVRFVDVARRVPWRQRPQGWWDLLAILGGAFAGYLFLVYSSIRGLPRPAFLGSGRESWFDFLPTIALLAVPILVVILRRPLGAAAAPLLTALGRLPVAARVLLAMAIVGGGWVVTRTPLFVRREGVDLVTPLLMVALPLALVWFRREVDLVLAPLQPIRAHIPRLILVGIGLAVPFLTAFVIYRWLGISQYPLLRANVVVGTLLSYAVLRTPRRPGSGGRIAAAGQALLVVAVMLVAGELGADDFYRDPFNLNDGLRTPGVAPVIAGIASVVVSILVNGVEVAVVTLQATAPTEDGSTPPRKTFVVVVDSTDAKGLPSTSLSSDPGAAVFISAHCEEVGVGPFPAGDGTIRFSLLSAQEWVRLEDLGMAHGRRCARVVFADPLPQGEPPATAAVDVAAGAGGGLVNAGLTLTLELGLALAVEQTGGERVTSTDPGRPTFRVRYSPAHKKWELGELVVYFHRPGRTTPERPPFTPVWDRPEATPDYLELGPPTSADGGLTWRLRPTLRRGVDLSDEWLQSQGEIEVRISCTEQRA